MGLCWVSGPEYRSGATVAGRATGIGRTSGNGAEWTRTTRARTPGPCRPSPQPPPPALLLHLPPPGSPPSPCRTRSPPRSRSPSSRSPPVYTSAWCSCTSRRRTRSPSSTGGRSTSGSTPSSSRTGSSSPPTRCSRTSRSRSVPRCGPRTPTSRRPAGTTSPRWTAPPSTAICCPATPSRTSCAVPGTSSWPRTTTRTVRTAFAATSPSSYLRRIVVLRLDREQAGGRGAVVQQVQVRSRTTNVPPPKWSQEQVTDKPIVRELPWWPVSETDRAAGTRPARPTGTEASAR